MNKRKACFVGLAASATLLAGCVAQYRNPGACEQEMRRRLADVSPAELSVTHSAVAYRGQRVVVEGTLDRALAPASAAVAAASAAQEASVGAAASGVQPAAARGTSSAVAASGTAVMASGASAAVAAMAGSEPRATTPLGAIARKLGIKKPVHPAAAAECTFDESGLTAFRWLAPPALAKTTPDPNASDD